MTTPVAQFSGLASGIDTSGIIAQLQKVAQAPITNLQNTEAGYNDKLTAWQDFNSRLASLQSATAALTQSATFSSVSGVSTNTSVASFTAAAGATVGNHSLSIQQLAQAQKVVSQSQSSSSNALGLAGTFILNGKTITTRASDTLADISSSINAAGAGVSASVVTVGAGDFRLTLTGTTTGAASAFSAADSSSGAAVLSSLGLLSGSPAIRQTITPSAGQTGAVSLTLGNATQSIASALGLAASPPLPAGPFAINGTTISGIDLNTDSLTTIANKINGAQIAGITAKVVSLPDANGNATVNSPRQLQIISSNTDGHGNAVAPAFIGDTSGVLTSLGIVQQNFTNVLSTPQDAKFTLDGLNLTRASNLVTDAVPGGTLKLLSGTSASPGLTTLSVAQNTDSVVSSVSNFVNAYNGIQDFVTLQNQFTPATAADGTTSPTNPLFGDTTLASVQDTLNQALSAVSGSTTLQDIGITFNSKSDLTLDAAKLTTALQNDPDQVSGLFGQTGSTDNAGVSFLGTTSKTQATAGAGYAVQISQAATQASGTAAVAQASVNNGPAETLTFGGTQFSTPVSLTLTQGSSLQDTVNQINGSGALSGRIYASINPTTHALTLSAQQYGAGNGFTVQSNLAASSSNSGIGTGTIITDGTDVAGTINGEAATGKGRTLTGASGNATTDGLSVLVSATPSDITSSPTYNSATHSASFGHVNFTNGIANALTSTLTQLLDPVNGAIIGAENSINSQITDAQKQITTLQTNVADYTAYLQQLFSAMETRVSALQAQGSAFAAQTGTTSTTKR